MDAEERRKQAAQEAGAALITQMLALSSAVTVYELNNQILIKLGESIAAALKAYEDVCEAGLRLTLLEDEIFVDGRLLRVDAQLYLRGRELAKALARLGVGELSFSPGVSRESLWPFIEDLFKSVRAGHSQLKEGGYEGLSLAPSVGRLASAVKMDPDRMAISLYSTLLSQVEALFTAHDAGRKPNLLSLKRSLQLVIDAIGGHGPLFQMLAQVHDPRVPVSHAGVRVGIAVDAVAFGTWLGLTKDELMTLGLAALLGDLAHTDDPDEAVRPLFGFPGLGSSAVPLILTLHDTWAARRGEAACVPGRILAVVSTWFEWISTTEERKGVAPPRVLEAMLSGKLKGVDKGVARVFAEFKGPFPLGSVVSLSDGGEALVVGVPEDLSQARSPSVKRIQPAGGLGPLERLTAPGAPKITGAPSAAEAGVNLMVA